MTNIKKQPSQDEQIGDFADRVIKGQMKNTASDANEELHGLEETVLRLHNSMPTSSLEESAKKQMFVRLNTRIRRENEKAGQKDSFWKTLFNTEWLRPGFAITAGMVALLIAVAILSPNLGSVDSSTTVGTALNPNSNLFIVIGLVVIILGILWFSRRK